MRKELEFPIIDESKIEYVGRLIDIIEIVSIIKKYLCEVDDVKADYYIELLHKNLPICDVLDYVLREDTPEKIANELLMNSKNNIIFL